MPKLAAGTKFVLFRIKRGPFEGISVLVHYAVVFLVIALIAALFGFGGIAAGAAGIAKLLFFVFVIMAVVAFAVGLSRKS
jgi:uncharacterized membrane protein YtjA (UPF0391 family)